MLKEHPTKRDFDDIEKKYHKLKEANIIREEADQANPAELVAESIDPDRPKETLKPEELIREKQVRDIEYLQNQVNQLSSVSGQSIENWKKFMEYKQSLDKLREISGSKNG